MQIARGAEAAIIREDGTVLKERVKKGYRIAALDEKLRRKRTRSEAALLRDARRAGVRVPGILEESGFSLRMEFIEGEKLKDAFNKGNAEELGKKIAQSVAKLHSYGIIHGDLTTSNMILRGGELHLIDFGLGFHSNRTEDKAVDLHVLHEALESTHHELKGPLWEAMLETYSGHFAEAKKVIKTLDEIEKRGRYRNRAETNG